MAETASGILQCFNCDAKFEDTQKFWDHIYNVDCGTNEDTTNFPKENLKPASSPARPKEQAASVEVCVSPTESTRGRDSFLCGLCNETFGSNNDLYAHTQSANHRERVASAANRYVTGNNPKKWPNKWLSEDPQQPLFCEDCQVPLPSLAAKDAHIIGKKHQRVIALLAMKKTPGWTPGQVTSSIRNDATRSYGLEKVETSHLFCEYCQVTLPDRQAARLHLTCNDHIEAMSKHNNCGVHPTTPNQTGTIQSSLSPLADSNMSELNALLRRLCLTQLLALMHGLDGAVYKGGGPTTCPPNEEAFAR
ncbi:zinc finger, C2H2 type, partial [Opisthorchis viverrini]